MFGLNKSALLGATLFLLPLLKGNVSAQSVDNYSVSRSTGITYNSIFSTGNSFSAWRYTGAFSEDDNRSEATDIGFDFWYNGQRYTQFSVSTNGFLDFSNSVDDGGPQCDDYGYCNFRFSDTDINNGTWLALAPFYDDMTTGGGVDPLGTSIKYLLSGTSPNRVLTVEWDAMAVYQNTTPDVNFQVKIYETTGVIEYDYETMVSGTNTFSYTIGINAASISSPPTVSELLTQQTANSTSFSNTAQNNIATMPAANSQLQFTPLLPANPSSTLTFSGITNTGMTLNWSDWATNEVGYVIYSSTDDINYFFETQTGTSATSTTIFGLLPSTTYYWRVYAVTEGTLSLALSGNATTLAPGTVTSLSDGRWDQTARWDCACIPTAADNVIVNHNVRVSNADAQCNDLTVQTTAGRVRFTGGTGRTLTVNGNIAIASGARLVVANNSNTTHTLNIRGNIVNDGTFNIGKDPDSYAITNFTKTNGNQLVGGTGGTNTFYTINIDKLLKSNVLEIASSNFSCNSDALSFISGGTFKFSSTGTNNFSLFSTTKDIPSNGKIWMNSAGSMMNFGAGINLKGDLVLDNGTVVIGDAVDESIISFGGLLEINGGNITVAGRYDRNNSESTSNYIQTGGTLTLPTVGSSSTTIAPFSMNVIGSSLTISGGTIIIEREGGSGTENLGYNTAGLSSSTVTGGTLQIGNSNTPAGQVMSINAGSSIDNLLINSTNATAQLSSNNLNVIGNITLTAGVLDENNLDISISGDWLASGGNYLPSSTGMVTFSGANQSITTSGSAFNHLVLSGTQNKSFQDNLDVNGNLTISATFNPVNSGFIANMGGNWINNGSFNRNNETIIFDGAINQIINGTSASDFTNITINKSAGSVSIESTVNLFQTLDLQSATTFDADGSGSGVFTLVSNSIEDARIASLAVGATITGNVVFEKYFAGTGSKYWRHISSSVTGATIADLQNEIPISGTFTGNNNGTGVIPANASPSLYYYDNSTGLPTETREDRWVVYPTSTNTELLTTTGTEGRGYAIWDRDTGPVTFDLTGTMNQGNIDFLPIGNNEGWNLLGNPYPSDIDWDAAGWTKIDIQGNAINIWDGTQYLTWNGSVGNLGNGRIAKGQGFWIQAFSGSVGLTATEAVKTAVSTTTYRTFDEDSPQYIELSVSASGYNDRAYIQFNDLASFEFDNTDAAKLGNPIFNLSTLSSDSVELSINLIGSNKCMFDVPVVLSNTWNDSYSFSWNISHELLDQYSISVEDLVTSTTYDMNNSKVGFIFEINADLQSQQNNRFILHFETAPIKDVNLEASQDCDNLSKAHITLNTSQFGVEYSLWLGETKIDSLDGTGDLITFDLDGLNLVTGLNAFKIKASRPTCTELPGIEFEATLEILEKPIIGYNADSNLLVNNTGQVGIWYNNDEVISSQPTLSYTPNLIQGGAYSILVNSDNCESKSDPFLVTEIEELSALDQIRISPNPAINYIELFYQNNLLSNVTYYIIDVSGRIQSSGNITSGTNRIDISSYKRGLYMLLIDSEDKSIKLRFLKL